MSLKLRKSAKPTQSLEPRKPPQEEYPMVLKPSHIAKIMGVSPPTAYKYMKIPGFPIIKLPGETVRAHRDLFFEWLRNRTVGAS